MFLRGGSVNALCVDLAGTDRKLSVGELWLTVRRIDGNREGR